MKWHLTLCTDGGSHSVVAKASLCRASLWVKEASRSADPIRSTSRDSADRAVLARGLC